MPWPRGSNILHVKLNAHPQGYLKIWKPPALGKRYVVGVDVSEGVEGGDYSCAYVLDGDDESIVANWHGLIEPEALGKSELPKLGYLYNKASIGVESNNHGLTTLTGLKNANYPRIFYHKSLECAAEGRSAWDLGPTLKQNRCSKIWSAHT